jgi:hypothetical protein
MRTHSKLLICTLIVAATGWIAGCNSHIDSKPNVVLEVDQFVVPPITNTRNATTGLCTFLVNNATATFKDKPKNSLAGQDPFNDIALQSVLVDYVWDDGVGVTQATFGVGGTVPAGGSSSEQFSVVNGNDLITPDRGGHTARMTLTFYGTTVAGEAVSASIGGSLNVNTCQ